MRKIGCGAVAPLRRPEEPQESSSQSVVETEVIELMGVFVLHGAPGECSGIQEIRVQCDLPGNGERVRTADDVDGDHGRHETPVERARGEGRDD